VFIEKKKKENKKLTQINQTPAQINLTQTLYKCIEFELKLLK
jgi:hypothetical protein